MDDPAVLRSDGMPAGSLRSAPRSVADGPWWLEGTYPRRLRREPFPGPPPTLVVTGALWLVLLGSFLAWIGIPQTACWPPRPPPTLMEVLGVHLTGAALVVATRVRTSRRLRAAFLLPALALAATTIYAWSRPRALDMQRSLSPAIVMRVSGGIVSSLGVYALSHWKDASRGLGRALTFVTFAPFVLGPLAAALTRWLVPVESITAFTAFGVAMGVGSAVAWALAARSAARPLAAPSPSS